MKYLCLIYYSAQVLEGLDGAEREQLMAECSACSDQLHRSGHQLAAQALEPVATAITLRERGSKVLVTDGPSAETKEQLGGFCLIEARDLNEAIQLAGRMPLARYGCVEVRPVLAPPVHPEGRTAAHL
jgi:hypothetical protein